MSERETSSAAHTAPPDEFTDDVLAGVLTDEEREYLREQDPLTGELIEPSLALKLLDLLEAAEAWIADWDSYLRWRRELRNG